MYSFSGANHNLRRKRVSDRTKLYNWHDCDGTRYVWRSKPKRVRSRFPIGIAPGKDFPELTRLSCIFAGWRGRLKKFLTLCRGPTRAPTIGSPCMWVGPKRYMWCRG
jgi:hypothetical protein